MRVLLTNDDGIGAEGMHAVRRALMQIEGIEVHVIVPDSNRSATARSITTRSPLSVEAVALDDDITHSGTVAAALEGIVLGIPAIAISQQGSAQEMGFLPGRSFDFAVAAGIGAQLVRMLAGSPLPAETLLNVNVPAGEPEGIEVTGLGKRLYNDKLRLVGEDEDGRRRYQIYGFEPSFEDEPGTDLAAVARGRISVTPVHFDLTDRDELTRLREWDLDRIFREVLAGVTP